MNPNITAEIVADSINPAGNRITSWLLTYPRLMHSEFMTHRLFSRNAGSSRARPFKVVMREVEQNPVIRSRWLKEQSGMQGGEELGIIERSICEHEWDAARLACLDAAEVCANEGGAHKDIPNRIIEPWTYIKVLATATDHGNFFALRADRAALSEFQELAYKMLAKYLDSNPNVLQWGEWHLPYGDRMEPGWSDYTKVKIATARACWVSYHKPDKTEFIFEDAIKRHDEGVQFKHWSPFEHCAHAVKRQGSLADLSNFDFGGAMPGEWKGWKQYRKCFLQEIAVLDEEKMRAILRDKPEWIKL